MHRGQDPLTLQLAGRGWVSKRLHACQWRLSDARRMKGRDVEQGTERFSGPSVFANYVLRTSNLITSRWWVRASSSRAVSIVREGEPRVSDQLNRVQNVPRRWIESSKQRWHRSFSLLFLFRVSLPSFASSLKRLMKFIEVEFNREFPSSSQSSLFYSLTNFT